MLAISWEAPSPFGFPSASGGLAFLVLETRSPWL